MAALARVVIESDIVPRTRTFKCRGYPAQSKTRYSMRARRVSTGATVRWSCAHAPDTEGLLNGVTTTSDLTDVVIESVVTVP